MGKQIVLTGGGHAHMTVMVKGHVFHEHGHQVILISQSPHHYYSGMGPGMLSGIYKPEEIRFNVKKMIEDRHGRYIQDSVVRVDPEQKKLILKSGSPVDYDVVSFNVGSFIPSDFVEGMGENAFTVKPIINLLKGREEILAWSKDKTMKILLIGGGPAGVELAGNLSRLARDEAIQAEITLVAGKRLLRKFPERTRSIALKSFGRRGIHVIEGVHIEQLKSTEAVFDDGRTIPYDLVFLASGVRPPSLFHESGIPTDTNGGMLVNRYLQSISYPEIFGGGDCISLQGRPLEKVGVYAVRENPVLYHNLLAFAEGRALNEFDPGKGYLLIFNLGDGRGIFWRGSWVWDGKLAFLLKDYIDQKFMRKFQVSGEREE